MSVHLLDSMLDSLVPYIMRKTQRKIKHIRSSTIFLFT